MLVVVVVVFQAKSKRIKFSVIKCLEYFIEIAKFFFFSFSFFKSRPPYQVGKKGKGCARLVCQKREFAARSSSCEVSSVKFIKDPKFKHEI